MLKLCLPPQNLNNDTREALESHRADPRQKFVFATVLNGRVCFVFREIEREGSGGQQGRIPKLEHSGDRR